MRRSDKRPMHWRILLYIRSTLGGHATEEPLQYESSSQVPKENPHLWSLKRRTLAGQKGETLSQYESASHKPVEFEHRVDVGSRVLAGHAEDDPVQEASFSHTYNLLAQLCD